MSDPIDRRTILASSLAWAAVTLSGCSDNGGSGGTGGTSGTAGTSASGTAGNSGGGGTGGAGAAGAAGTGGSAYACVNSMTGTHMHPLTVPGSDVERGYQDAPYTLQDGGTGHTHTLELTAYDYVYLQAGATRMIDSSTTSSHLHTVTITCTMS
jgi:hypothetical protein